MEKFSRPHYAPKISSRRMRLRNLTNVAYLEDAPTLQQQIQGLMKATQESLENKTKDQLNSIVLSVETINQQIANMAAKKDVEPIGQLKKDIEALNENLKKNQEVIDNFVASQDKKKVEKKDFGTTWQETIVAEMDKKKDEFAELQKNRNASVRLELKVGTMVIANVTGDTQASYNSRQGLVPNQKINMRDLLPTTPSPTGVFVTYRETATSGAIAVQTEGSAKSEIDYSFTNIKTVSKYIAGTARFSKQLMYAMPFLNTTLPRMLLRDFYKKENDYIYSAMQAAATGTNTTPTNIPIEQVISEVANQRKANFNSSYGLIDWDLWAHFLTTKPNDYSTPGGTTIDANGVVRVAGVPMIGASFADLDTLLLWDNDEVERVETETISVTFSYEDQDNFVKNLVTAKVECFEELNVLRPDSIINAELGS